MADPLQRAVVVTGASSGVGRATAHAFARRGAGLALCARGREGLEEVARECRELGGEAIAVPTDLRDPEAVVRLADVAAATFDGIGVWVNNAGVGVVGRYWEAPIAAHRATVETNLLGSMHGAHAALPHFLRQGSGVLINNVSVGGFIPTPFAAAYAASKVGLRAFSRSLRQELRGWRGIHVCDVYPYFMDTPGVQHAANFTGRALKQAPLLYRPETTAEAIVRLAHHPRPETIVGVMGKLAVLGHALAPGLVEWGLGRAAEAYFRYVAEPAPATAGNLEAPTAGPLAVHGGWRRPGQRAGALAGVGLAVAAILAWASLARR